MSDPEIGTQRRQGRPPLGCRSPYLFFDFWQIVLSFCCSQSMKPAVVVILLIDRYVFV